LVGLTGSGRPGTRADRRAASAAAAELLARLRGGADPDGLAQELAAQLPEGPARRTAGWIRALSGKVCGLDDLEPLAGALRGLGLGCDTALALLLAPRGEWVELGAWPGLLLARVEEQVRVPGAEAADLLLRMGFRAWLAERLRTPDASR